MFHSQTLVPESDIDNERQFFCNRVSPVVECVILFSCVTWGGRGGVRGEGGGGRGEEGGGGERGRGAELEGRELSVYKLHHVKVAEETNR